MIRWLLIPGVRIALALAALALTASAGQAQSTGSSNPYWGTSPGSSRGSNVRVPVPGASPNVSNAARSGPTVPGGSGSSIGGAYLPPSLRRLGDHDLELPSGDAQTVDNRAHLLLTVPRDAQIWVEGVKTKQSGERRYFYSPPLRPGQRYAYRLHVRWTKDGKVIEENQRFEVYAGATIRRDLTRAKESDSAAKR